jgi:NDP-sugar pyrophosphorylase family protein
MVDHFCARPCELPFERVPMVLLAGGRGTRLAPLTDKVPKSLVDVAGRPFIEHQLRLFQRAGIHELVICVGYRGEQITSRLGSGAHLGLEIHYVCDGPTPSGTGGALRAAGRHLPDVFWVSVGDMFLDLDYRAMFEQFLGSGKPVMMAVIPNRGDRDMSNVLMRDGQLVRYDKGHRVRGMQYIDSGLALVHKRMLDFIPRQGASDLADLLMGLSNRGEIAAFEADIPYRDIGNPAALADTRSYLAQVAHAQHAICP